MIRATVAFLLTLPLFWAPASARSDPAFQQLSATQQLVVQASRAYVVIRVRRPSSAAVWLAPYFLRVPDVRESESFEALRRAAFANAGPKAGPYSQLAFQNKNFGNLYAVDVDHPIADSGKERTYLLDLQPGKYVLAGVGTKRFMSSCFCLGTVQLDAQAGEVNDAGTFFADMESKPSPEPELASVTNKGATAQIDYPNMAGAVRPYRESDSFPASMPNRHAVPADYRAVGAFILRDALVVTFLAPVPGVLDYRRGEVVDIKSGKVLQPR